ncbi:lactate utilization protein [Telluria mixta]|uniref:Lactate utilization protein n=1 Tax=Telluria mixta TaxID=34071 RepID=A0ABT2BUJ1_9BURK|nr:lactate utilization protein [Telluria mixta]MCS0628794.1 lactate utilization protein [Telluria mixta]WEM97249.1 lactate utilization protein [Telluria mixta]
MNARDRILGRLRAATPHGAGINDLERRIAAHFDTRRDDTSQNVLARRMQAALEAVRAQAWCAGAGEWPALLAQRIVDAGVRRIVVDAATPEGRALRAALPANVEPIAFDRPLEHWKAELFGTVDAGFTVARSGIAATGTLVLAPDAISPRTVSLVPPLHIALVYAHTLHADLHQALHTERWQDGMPTNLVLATGPSRTSDIQQTLAFGAHGPRWTWVVIVTGEPA